MDYCVCLSINFIWRFWSGTSTSPQTQFIAFGIRSKLGCPMNKNLSYLRKAVLKSFLRLFSRDLTIGCCFVAIKRLFCHFVHSTANNFHIFHVKARLLHEVFRMLLFPPFLTASHVIARFWLVHLRDLDHVMNYFGAIFRANCVSSVLIRGILENNFLIILFY